MTIDPTRKQESGTPEPSAATRRREPPFCEVKHCSNRAVGLLEDPYGVRWAVCEEHAKRKLDEWGYPERSMEERANDPGHP